MKGAEGGRKGEPRGSAGLLARLREAGLLPRKPLGQHFLHDPRLLESLVRESGVQPGDSVFEVGPGPGALTRQLAARVQRVLAVEIDPRLLAFAARELEPFGNVQLLEADALGGEGLLAPVVLEHLRALGPFAWVSNLPYNIASRLVLAMLSSSLPLTRASLLVQLEVAERAVARPGDSAYGPLSLLIRFWAEARPGRRVPPGAFWPPPRVDSRVVHLVPRAPLAAPEDYRPYARWVDALFQGRRKQLGGLLRRLLGPAEAESALARAGIPPRLRPEQVGPELFIRLAREFPAFSR